jgi:tryptophan 2,3-dioxygenase
MARDYSIPVLEGPGDNDYVRYMRTDELLSLQRGPGLWIHRDELLFQVVHQSTELWLKLGVAELTEAARLIRSESPPAAAALVDRACLAVRLVTDQLDMLRHLSPHDFQTIRTVLGNGSGFESPGWRGMRSAGTELSAAWNDLVAERGIDLVDLYHTGTDLHLYRLAEALVSWDERVAMWRVNHYKLALRVIGGGTIGTQGTPVEVLQRLISHRFFPDLWDVRSALTWTGPMHAGDAGMEP